jgi:GntR family transcriptional regulator
MIHLNYRDSRPIYEQLKDGLRRLVVTHAIDADERLPSVREMATKLAINPNTIQRAYRELESEGYVYTVAGRGTFAASKEDISALRPQELLQQFEEIVKELLFLSVSAQELHTKITNLEEGRQN